MFYSSHKKRNDNEGKKKEKKEKKSMDEALPHLKGRPKMIKRVWQCGCGCFLNNFLCQNTCQ
jgi:hypothetical protein